MTAADPEGVDDTGGLVVPWRRVRCELQVVERRDVAELVVGELVGEGPGGEDYLVHRNDALTVSPDGTSVEFVAARTPGEAVVYSPTTLKGHVTWTAHGCSGTALVPASWLVVEVEPPNAGAVVHACGKASSRRFGDATYRLRLPAGQRCEVHVEWTDADIAPSDRISGSQSVELSPRAEHRMRFAMPQPRPVEPN